MWKPETVQKKCNEKLSKLLIEFEHKVCESLGTNWQGIKITVKTMVENEKNSSGIATAYVMQKRAVEFTNTIDTKHPIFKNHNS